MTEILLTVIIILLIINIVIALTKNNRLCLLYTSDAADE